MRERVEAVFGPFAQPHARAVRLDQQGDVAHGLRRAEDVAVLELDEVAAPDAHRAVAVLAEEVHHRAVRQPDERARARLPDLARREPDALVVARRAQHLLGGGARRRMERGDGLGRPPVRHAVEAPQLLDPPVLVPAFHLVVGARVDQLVELRHQDPVARERQRAAVAHLVADRRRYALVRGQQPVRVLLQTVQALHAHAVLRDGPHLTRQGRRREVRQAVQALQQRLGAEVAVPLPGEDAVVHLLAQHVRPAERHRAVREPRHQGAFLLGQAGRAVLDHEHGAAGVLRAESLVAQHVRHGRLEERLAESLAALVVAEDLRLHAPAHQMGACTVDAAELQRPHELRVHARHGHHEVVPHVVELVLRAHRHPHPRGVHRRRELPRRDCSPRGVRALVGRERVLALQVLVVPARRDPVRRTPHRQGGARVLRAPHVLPCADTLDVLARPQVAQERRMSLAARALVPLGVRLVRVAERVVARPGHPRNLRPVHQNRPGLPRVDPGVVLLLDRARALPPLHAGMENRLAAALRELRVGTVHGLHRLLPVEDALALLHRQHREVGRVDECHLHGPPISYLTAFSSRLRSSSFRRPTTSTSSARNFSRSSVSSAFHVSGLSPQSRSFSPRDAV